MTNEKTNARNGKENRVGVGKMITNIMANASAACYIGQNGLYQPNGKVNGKINKNNNGLSDGQTSNAQEYSNVTKKRL